MTHGAPILWLCGASGVGKSTVGYEVFRLLYTAGLKSAYVDLDQIGFARPAPSADPDNHRLKSRNLALLWASFRVEQVQRLVISGIVDSDEAIKMHRDAVPETEIAVFRLTAGRTQLRSRIFSRGVGGGPPIPGDAMKGKSDEWLTNAADDSIAEADEMERRSLGDVSIATDDLSVNEVAHIVRGLWLPPSDGNPQRDPH